MRYYIYRCYVLTIYREQGPSNQRDLDPGVNERRVRWLHGVRSASLSVCVSRVTSLRFKWYVGYGFVTWRELLFCGVGSVLWVADHLR